ncbi:MAG: FlgD immunoglobulin-like domain containing protein [Stellaceae bacterium]
MTTAASALPATVATLPSGNPAPSSPTGPNQTLTEDDFLRLLTAQLQHQDPLNPLSGAEFAAELAQFSTANGIHDLENTLTGMSAQSAVGLIGHNVAISGNALQLGQNGGATGAFTLSAAAKSVSVTVTDATGKAVANLNLGPMAAGSQTFSWDGTGGGGTRLPPGSYGFAINAVGSNGAAVTASPYAVVAVQGVSLGGQNGPMLDLGAGLAPVPLSAVQQVF